MHYLFFQNFRILYTFKPCDPLFVTNENISRISFRTNSRKIKISLKK